MAKTRAKKKAQTKATKTAVKKDVLSSLNPEQKEIPIKQDNIKLLQFTYKSKQPVNSKTIQAAGEQLLLNAQAKIAEFGLEAEPQVMATVLFDQSIGWQSGKFSGVNDDEIDLYKFEDQYEYEGEPLQTEYKNFNLTLKLVKTTGGWCDNFEDSANQQRDNYLHDTYTIVQKKTYFNKKRKNDCLWHCLNQAFRETRLPRSINLPHLLKRKLGLARKAMVPVSKLPMLSQILKVELNVVGDVEQHHNQAKDGVYTKKLTLKLHDQHYTLAKKHAIDNQLRGSTSVMDRPIVLYSEVNSADTGALSYLAYNSPDMRPLAREQLELFWTKPQSSKHIYRKSQFSKNFEKHCATEYAEIERDANQLKVSTKGLINLHRQLNETKSALFVFAKLNAMMTPPAKIGQLESTWIDAAKSGGLIWANEAPVELGTACQYDINSFYPSLLTRQAFSIPVGEGTFKHIAELPPDFALYGLYKCHISSANTLNAANTNEWFKFKSTINSANSIYTHYDINVARKLGMTVTMSTVSPNVLLFEERVPARSVFKPFVDYIYDLRKTVPDATKPRVKKIMNCLWGGLCAKRKTKVDMNKVNVLDLEGRSVTHIEPFGNSLLVTVERNENRYKTSYARMLPFITSYGRHIMFKELHPFKDSIHRIHTDGFIADRKLDLKLSTKLGGWKIEKQGKCRIKNSKHVEWE